MVQRVKLFVDGVWSQARQSDYHWGILSFYAGVLFYLGYLWTHARKFEGENLAPLTLYITAFLCVFGIVSHVIVAKEYVPNPFEQAGLMEATDQGGEAEEEIVSEKTGDQSDPSEGDKSMLPMIKTIASLILFTLLIPFLGFFSSSFIFSFLFIFDRTRDPHKTLPAATILTVLFYVLFIEILGNYLLLRVGLIDKFVFEELLI